MNITNKMNRTVTVWSGQMATYQNVVGISRSSTTITTWLAVSQSQWRLVRIAYGRREAYSHLNMLLRGQVLKFRSTREYVCSSEESDQNKEKTGGVRLAYHMGRPSGKHKLIW